MDVVKNQHTILLCNNEISFPAIRELAFYGSLKALVVPEKNKMVFALLQQFVVNSGIRIVSVNKKSLHVVLTNLIREVEARAVWLMTFPYILPGSLLSLLPGAFINFHYGLLPKYRGPDPILAQMLQYETHGGITVHVMDEGIDTGPVILQHKIPIEDMDTFGMQLQKLAALGAEMAVHLLKILHSGTVIPAVPQDAGRACYFNKITASGITIQWNVMSSMQIIRMINACNPWNKGAGTSLKNNSICFVEVEATENTSNEDLMPGTITALSREEGLKIYCIDRKIIRVNIIYLQEGVFSAAKLVDFGIRAGDKFV